MEKVKFIGIGCEVLEKKAYFIPPIYMVKDKELKEVQEECLQTMDIFAVINIQTNCAYIYKGIDAEKLLLEYIPLFAKLYAEYLDGDIVIDRVEDLRLAFDRNYLYYTLMPPQKKKYLDS